MKLNFFFDLDGTLLPMGEGPRQSALEAISKARGEGHRIFLCTGRSPAELPQELDEVTVDGGVFSAGGTVVLDGEEKWRKRFSEEEKEFVIHYAERMNLLPMVQTDEGTYMTPEAFDYFNSSLIAKMGKTIKVPNLFVVDSLPEDLVVNKYLFLTKEGIVKKVREDLSGRFTVVDNTVGIDLDNMAEIVLRGVDKGTGMAKIVEILGEGRESTVGIGDGANDMEMVEYAGLGVAMGNASEELKAVADFITGDASEDGIKEALEYAMEVYLPSIS